jgi:oligopeptidase B
MNTFTDFLACAHALVDGGWSEPDRIIARGGSAGGLLVGAAMNLEPATFAGVVAEVPFVDCVTTMLDASLPLTVGEYEEWGNPESSPEVFHTMLSYSPYDNVAGVDQAGNPITYPDLYITAGLNDSRVGYFEPAKWVAKIRSVSPASTVIFHTDLGAGHGGPSGRYESWRDEAKVATFILSTFAKD